MAGNSKDGSAEVISFTKARDAKIEEKRRKYERVVFKHILGAYCVSEGQGLKAIELVDLSAEGLSFQLPATSKNLDGIAVEAEMIFRLYITPDTFFPVQVKILNKRAAIENGETYYRFGCSVDSTLSSYQIYKCFVEFLEKYASGCQQDQSDMKFFFF
jgi:hypothetical protein